MKNRKYAHPLDMGTPKAAKTVQKKKALEGKKEEAPGSQPRKQRQQRKSVSTKTAPSSTAAGRTTEGAQRVALKRTTASAAKDSQNGEGAPDDVENNEFSVIAPPPGRAHPTLSSSRAEEGPVSSAPNAAREFPIDASSSRTVVTARLMMEWGELECSCSNEAERNGIAKRISETFTAAGQKMSVNAVYSQRKRFKVLNMSLEVLLQKARAEQSNVIWERARKSPVAAAAEEQKGQEQDRLTAAVAAASAKAETTQASLTLGF